MQTESRRINVYLNAEDAQKTLDNLAAKSEKAKAKLELLRQQGKENSAEFAQTAQDVERLAQKQQLLADKMSGKVSPSLRDMKKNISIMQREIQELSFGTEKFENKLLQLANAQHALAQVEAEMKETAAAVKMGTLSIDNMRQTVSILEKELNQLTVGTQAWNAKLQQLNAAKKTLADVETSVKGVDNAIRKGANLSLEDMRHNVQVLEKELTTLATKTDAWKKKVLELQAAKKVLADIELQVKDTRTTWQRFKDDFKQFGMIASANIVGEVISMLVMAVWQFVGKIMENAAKISDQLTAIEKTAQMTTAEVKEFNKQLSNIDTRTTTSDLREMARVGGQFGIAKDELLGFVKAVDKINIALNDEFSGGPEQIAKDLSKMKSLFKEVKDMEAGEAVERIGSAVNELGAAGTATGPEIAEFTQRIGALGPALSPTIAQTMGLGAVMEELGLTAQISAGGITAVMLQAGKETGKFAAQIGMTEEQFKKLLNSNPNQMLLTLAESFQGLEADEVAKALARLGIGTQEAVKVMQLLSANTDMVRDKQALAAKAMAENTSISEEAAKMQKNFAGEYNKTINELNGIVAAISQWLIPVLTKLLTFTIAFLKAIKELPAFIQENRRLLIGLAAAIAALNIKEAIAIVQKIKLNNIIKVQTILLNSYKRAVELANLAWRANPIGIVISLLIALGTALYNAWQESQTFRASVMGVLNVLKEIGLVIFETYKAFYTFDFKKLADLWENGGKRIGDAFNKGYNDRINSENAEAGIQKKYQETLKTRSQENPLLNNKMSDGYRAAVNAQGGERGMFGWSKDEIAEASKADEAARIAANKERQKKLEQEEKSKDDKLKQLVEQRRKEAAEAEKSIQEMRIGLMREGFDKELAMLHFQAQQKLADLKGTSAQQAEQRLLIEEKLQQDVAALTRKYADEEVLREQEQTDLIAQIRRDELDDELRRIEQFRQLTTIAAKNAYIQQAAELYENQKLTTEQRNAALAKLEDELRLKEIEAERTAIQEELDTRRAADMLTISEKVALELKLNELDLEARKTRIEQAKREKEEQLKIEQAKHEAKMRLAQAASNMLGQAASLAGEQTEFGKALTVAQIAIDTAAALSSVIRNNTATSLTPIDLAARIATGTALVLGAFVKVRNVLKEANVPKPPGGGMQITGGYQDGGFTPRAASDSKAVGIVHANEYVVPAPVLRTPDGANLVGMLEALRTGKRAPAEDAEGSSGGMRSALLQQLIAEVTGLRMEVADWNDRLKVIFVYEDFAEFDRKRVQVEKDSTI